MYVRLFSRILCVLVCVFAVSQPVMCGTFRNNSTCPLSGYSTVYSNQVWFQWSGGVLFGQDAGPQVGCQPGATFTFNHNGSGLGGSAVWVMYRPYWGGGDTTLGGPYYWDSDYPAVLSIPGQSGACGAVSNWYTANLCITNFSPAPIRMGFFTNSVLASWSIVGTGQRWCQSAGATNFFTAYMQQLNDYGEPFPIGNQYFASYGTNANGAGMNTNILGGSSNIGPQYNGSTNFVPGATVGDNALYTAISDFANRNHQDLLNVQGAATRTNPINVNVSQSNSYTNINNNSNYVSVNVTNNFSDMWSSNIFVMGTNQLGNTNFGVGGAAGTNKWNEFLGQGAAITNAFSDWGNLGMGNPDFSIDIPEFVLGDGGAGKTTGPEMAGIVIRGPRLGPQVLRLNANDERFAVFNYVKIATEVMVFVWLFLGVFKVFQRDVSLILKIQQVQTAGTSFFGVNVNAASAAFCAAVIVGIISIIFAAGIAALVNILVSCYTSYAALTPVVQSFDVAWGFCNRVMPVDVFIGAFVTYWGINLTSAIGTMAASVCIKMLVGL